MERKGKTVSKESNKALEYYRLYSDNNKLPKYFCGSFDDVVGTSHAPPIPIIRIEDKSTVEVDEDKARNPSPTSSVTSNRKLEWDYGADIGYENSANKSLLYKSLSLPVLSVKDVGLNVSSESRESDDKKLPKSGDSDDDKSCKSCASGKSRQRFESTVSHGERKSGSEDHVGSRDSDEPNQFLSDKLSIHFDDKESESKSESGKMSKNPGNRNSSSEDKKPDEGTKEILNYIKARVGLPVAHSTPFNKLEISETVAFEIKSESSSGSANKIKSSNDSPKITSSETSDSYKKSISKGVSSESSSNSNRVKTVTIDSSSDSNMGLNIAASTRKIESSESSTESKFSSNDKIILSQDLKSKPLDSYVDLYTPKIVKEKKVQNIQTLIENAERCVQVGLETEKLIQDKKPVLTPTSFYFEVKQSPNLKVGDAASGTSAYEGISLHPSTSILESTFDSKIENKENIESCSNNRKLESIKSSKLERKVETNENIESCNKKLKSKESRLSDKESKSTKSYLSDAKTKLNSESYFNGKTKNNENYLSDEKSNIKESYSKKQYYFTDAKSKCSESETKSQLSDKTTKESLENKTSATEETAKKWHCQLDLTLQQRVKYFNKYRDKKIKNLGLTKPVYVECLDPSNSKDKNIQTSIYIGCLDPSNLNDKNIQTSSENISIGIQTERSSGKSDKNHQSVLYMLHSQNEHYNTNSSTQTNSDMVFSNCNSFEFLNGSECDSGKSNKAVNDYHSKKLKRSTVKSDLTNLTSNSSSSKENYLSDLLAQQVSVEVDKKLELLQKLYKSKKYDKETKKYYFRKVLKSILNNQSEDSSVYSEKITPNIAANRERILKSFEDICSDDNNSGGSLGEVQDKNSDGQRYHVQTLSEQMQGENMDKYGVQRSRDLQDQNSDKQHYTKKSSKLQDRNSDEQYHNQGMRTVHENSDKQYRAQRWRRVQDENSDKQYHTQRSSKLQDTNSGKEYQTQNENSDKQYHTRRSGREQHQNSNEQYQRSREFRDQNSDTKCHTQRFKEVQDKNSDKQYHTQMSSELQDENSDDNKIIHTENLREIHLDNKQCCSDGSREVHLKTNVPWVPQIAPQNPKNKEREQKKLTSGDIQNIDRKQRNQIFTLISSPKKSSSSNLKNTTKIDERLKSCLFYKSSLNEVRKNNEIDGKKFHEKSESSSSNAQNSSEIEPCDLHDSNWKENKTLSEKILEIRNRKLSSGDSVESPNDELLFFAKRERENQISWINNEIEHLVKLKGLLEKREEEKKWEASKGLDNLPGVKKSTAIYMITTERGEGKREDEVPIRSSIIRNGDISQTKFMVTNDRGTTAYKVHELQTGSLSSTSSGKVRKNVQIQEDLIRPQIVGNKKKSELEGDDSDSVRKCRCRSKSPRSQSSKSEKCECRPTPTSPVKSKEFHVWKNRCKEVESNILEDDSSHQSFKSNTQHNGAKVNFSNAVLISSTVRQSLTNPGDSVRRLVLEIPIDSKENQAQVNREEVISKQVQTSKSLLESNAESTSSESSVSSSTCSDGSLVLCSCCRKLIAASESSIAINSELYTNITPPPVFCQPCFTESKKETFNPATPYFQQPQHQCKCHNHNINNNINNNVNKNSNNNNNLDPESINKIRTTLKELEELEEREKYCRCLNRKSGRLGDNVCTSCKCKVKHLKSSKEPVAYLLTFEPGDFEIPKVKHRVKSLEEVKIKIPSSHKSRKKKSEEEKRGEDKEEGNKKKHKNSKHKIKKSLQEYLESNHPSFVRAAEERRKCMIDLAYMREQRCQKYKQLLALTNGIPMQKPCYTDMHQKRIFTSKEMKNMTAKTYKNLPEVQQKLVENRTKQIKKANRLLADIFNKKLRERVLLGNPNISASTSVINLV